jgi:hypothetical protein
MTLRRFAAVVRKRLIFLARRFFAAILRRFAAVPKKSTKSMCGGWWSGTPIPPMRFAAPCWRAPRAQQVFDQRPDDRHP